MAVITFRSDSEFKETIELLAKYKGINTSAYLKLNLTKAMRKDLAKITENGLTIAEELEIIKAENESKKGKNISPAISSKKDLKGYLDSLK